MRTVHKFALPSFICSTGALVKPTVQIPNYENSSVATRGRVQWLALLHHMSLQFQSAEVGLASSVVSLGLQCVVDAC